jgi:hypothetical protein
MTLNVHIVNTRIVVANLIYKFAVHKFLFEVFGRLKYFF